MSPLLRRIALAVASLVLAAPFAAAQDLHPSRRPSPMGLARTTLADDGTYVSVVYSRPYERGRDNIFGSEESGALVAYGQRWRTGANEATEITVTGDLTAGGEPLAAGTYSLTTVPGAESWTVHFNSVLGLNGTASRNPENGRFEQVDLGPTDVLVVTAPVGTLEEKVDQFTIAFDHAGGGADMCLRWITTEVCVPLRVVEWSSSEAPRQRLPAFEEFPASEAFTGEPAEVNLEGHPDAKTFRTALTRDAQAGAVDARFAGHYRIVVIGCGTSCRSVWAVDLVDGSLHDLFTASTGVAFRPDSRLIVENDPAYYEGLLDEMSAAEVEEMMDTYGPPRFWVEADGDFKQIGPQEVRIDSETKTLVPASRAQATSQWRCTNDLEVHCADGACEAETGDGFTPMSVLVETSGAMSVCAYSGCWEGTGKVIESAQFLVLIGHELAFSTSRDLESSNEDIVVAIDRADAVATLKAGEFVHPLLCERLEST